MAHVSPSRRSASTLRRSVVAGAVGALVAASGAVALSTSASADDPDWVTVDDEGFATFTIPVDEVEDAVGTEISQIVAEGNFGPSANWAEFGLSLDGDVASGILGPLDPGVYYYQITADDHLSMKDPTNSTSVGSEPEWSTFYVPGEGAELLGDAAPADQGAVEEFTYQSSVAGEERAAMAWTPPDYDVERSDPYPVLYLQHGGGQTYGDWVEVGRAAQIFDNLYAAGQIQPMVVIMGNGNVSSFADELFRNIVPTAEEEFNISDDPAQRALAGLSMGGGQSFDVLASDPGEFSSIGVFGSGSFLGAVDRLLASDQSIEEINTLTDFVRIYVGNPTDHAYNSTHEALAKLDDAGLAYQFDGANPDAGHNWDAWQENLIDFSQRLFQEGPSEGMSPGHTAIDEPFETPESGTTPTPWVSEDGFVTFETTAEFADAEHVTVWANWGASHLWTRVELSQDGDLWRGTVGPLDAGWYHYQLIVDMEAQKDTGNPTSVTTEPTWSQFFVPGDSARMVSPVPEGEGGVVQEMTYSSDVAGEERTSLVWTPPGYDANRSEPYPVFYLQHGGGQSYTDWTEMGQAKNILDNHFLDGNLEPMVVVMSNGNVDDFTTELLENIAPAAESQFHVSDDPAQRALAGLSMGGGQTMSVLTGEPGEFAYIGTFSAGYSGEASDLDVAAINEGTTLLRLYNGNISDFTYGGVVQAMETFDEAGVEYEFDGWFEGPHGWDTWQHALIDFAPRLFDSATADDSDGIEIEATVPEAADGYLSLTIADQGGRVTLGEASNAGDRLVMAGELPAVTVTDSRTDEQAAGTGWAVSGQSSELAGGRAAIGADHLGWSPTLSTERDGVVAGDAVDTVLGGGAGLAAPQRLVEATNEGRVGSISATAGLALEVPVDTEPGTYTGAVTVSLFPVD